MIDVGDGSTGAIFGGTEEEGIRMVESLVDLVSERHLGAT